MNPLIQLKKTTPPLLITVALLCLRLLPTALAVPEPDGGYSGFNTAEGQTALSSRTTGVGNTAVGWHSLFSTATGSFNTATGAGTLLFNTADANTAFGAAALLFNTTGINNAAVGAAALLNNTSGQENTATGASALSSNTEGDFNAATGAFALWVNTTGGRNTATGDSAMFSNTTGSRNAAIGNAALGQNTTGSDNVAVGASAGVNVTTASGVICIGTGGNNVDNSCYIGQIFDSTSSNGVAVLVNSNGRLGTMTSSARFKEEIKPMGEASEALFALKPVAFRYKKDIDPAGTPQLGLVAEDVERVNPDLVVRDKEGKPYSVRFDQVNAMLLNEFLKEHRKVEEQEATIARQQKQIEVLAAGLQKVNARLEVIRPAPQTALNNP